MWRGLQPEVRHGGAWRFGDGDGDVNGNGYGWCGGVRRWIKPAEDSENGETLV